MQGLVIGLSPILLVICLLMLIQSFTYKSSIRTFGHKVVIYTGVIGTSLHEIAHALMCVLFRHKIHEIKLFSPDVDGTLGYVKFSYDSRSLYQKVGLFFVGLAPFFMALLYFYAATFLLLEIDLLANSFSQFDIQLLMEEVRKFADSIFQASGWNLFVWGILMVSMVLHMMPSQLDLKGAKVGFVFLLLIYILISSVLFLIHRDLQWMFDGMYLFSVNLVLYLSKLTLCFVIFGLVIGIVNKAVQRVLFR